MKNKFNWYFPLSEEEIKVVWSEAILTLDANVLLDLYRYHEDTRNALLKALEKFKGRAWLSHQTAEEFFRNRKKVIFSSVNSYDEASQNISDIRTGVEDPLNRLKSNRIVSDQVAESVRTALADALDAAQAAINAAKERHPNFIESDPVLEEIAALFHESVGEGFTDDELAEATREGKQRLETKTPPGFMDSKKDGSRSYGDYFMWRQILSHAAKEKKPIIFVTSEGKEDWWEKVSGKTTGLHYQLLKEAHEKTEQRILAYRTDRFFRFSAKLSGEESNESAAEEISALVKERAAGAQLLRLTSQVEASATHTSNSGNLTVELLRPAYVFTCSGHLKPNLHEIPKVRARLVSHPEGLPRHIVRAGAGTTFDFNVHIKSTAYQEYLPIGEYVFEYEASIPDSVALDKEEAET